MADGDPSKWGYFEKMSIIPFLQLCLFQYNKQQDLKQQHELNKRR